MTSKWSQIIVVTLALFLVGNGLRYPQQSLTEELREQGFIEERLSQENQLKLGQTGAAVTLGGLRSLVAAFMNLQAFAKYEVGEWTEVEKLFDVIVTLQPKNSYYWETGSWHLAYNAYFDFDNKIGIAEPRRRLKQKEYLKKGEQFLLKGVGENPGYTQLWTNLGRLYADPHKPFNFPLAAMYFKKAADTEDAKPLNKREHFYTLGRVKGREKEAFDLGTKLLADPANRRFSSMNSLYYTLGTIAHPELLQSDEFLLNVFMGDKKFAYRDLVNYWQRTKREGFQKGNLEQVIKKLAKELDVPAEKNPFLNPNFTRLVEGL